MVVGAAWSRSGGRPLGPARGRLPPCWPARPRGASGAAARAWTARDAAARRCQDRPMAHPRAGQRAQPEDLVDVDALLEAYEGTTPDPDDPDQQVVFGTSGHRGSSLDGAFNEAHILAITQAICEYRAGEGITGPLVDRPRHARSVAARVAHRAPGARRQRRHGAHRRARLVDADTRCVARDPAAQPRGLARPGRRHRGDAVAQPAPRRRVQVQPAARRAGRLRRHGLDRVAGQRPAARGAARGEARLQRPHPRRSGGLRLPRALRRRPADGGRPRRDPRRRGAHRRRPARRRLGRVLGRDRRAAPPRPHGREPRGRPALGVHDPRHRRQDPDGLLLAERDGLAHRRQGRLRHLHRQRRRLRPARRSSPRTPA